MVHKTYRYFQIASKVLLFLSFSALMWSFVTTGNPYFLVISAATSSCLSLLLNLSISMLVKRKREGCGKLSISMPILVVTLAVFIFSSFAVMTSKVRSIAEKSSTNIYNMKMLYKAIASYSEANEQRLPDPNTWFDSLIPYSKNEIQFLHPQGDNIAVAYNSCLRGQKNADLPSNLVMFFEAIGGRNLTGEQSLLNSLDSYDSIEIIHVMYIDGSIHEYWKTRGGVSAYGDVFRELRWHPGTKWGNSRGQSTRKESIEK